MSSLLLMLAVITAGLYAGFLLTFLAVVMPGLALLPDERFVAAMRRFNEKVPGPGFLLVFLGVVALPAAALVSDLGGPASGSGCSSWRPWSVRWSATSSRSSGTFR
ncbi:hypothetical protein Sfulv_20560 [Streptomyces fulvorobeus]|uniref:DUF1772 domain-containing protein n=1 Tax=Streptomyces fulvorobeus TaxID=284028 RepID=A0A7J0C401_9ACTN|nr:hypothetical protein [Streptomyces fulvorobeus]GFM97245.1 hypothetical protein Sfulv_20560 [Streptomyces fulvorobeus]